MSDEGKAIVREYLQELPDRRYMTLMMRYGFWGRCFTYVEIGVFLGVCQERARQLDTETRAWLSRPWRLRDLMEAKSGISEWPTNQWEETLSIMEG